LPHGKGEQGTRNYHLIVSNLFFTKPSSDIKNIDEEKEMEANMIKKFGKKGHKQIKKLLDKLEEKKEILHEQEDLLILEKERNLALEKSLAEEKAKVEK
jgi:hypothetical protein